MTRWKMTGGLVVVALAAALLAPKLFARLTQAPRAIQTQPIPAVATPGVVVAPVVQVQVPVEPPPVVPIRRPTPEPRRIRAGSIIPEVRPLTPAELRASQLPAPEPELDAHWQGCGPCGRG